MKTLLLRGTTYHKDIPTKSKVHDDTEAHTRHTSQALDEAIEVHIYH
jgi:hypothetical protein